MPVRSRQRRHLKLKVMGALAFCLALGCSSVPPLGSATGTAPTKSGATFPRSPGAPRKVTKILVIMEENHSIGQVFPSEMPYLWSLAIRFGRATGWSDIGHPSLPNYLAIFGGSSFNDPQDCYPGPGCNFPGPSVFGQAVSKGETARAYEESMPTPCAPANSGDYDVNHNPWVYFPSESNLCRANDVPAGTVEAGALASDLSRGRLPTVGMITPDLSHDGHNGTLAQADAWLHSWIPALTSGPDWRAGRLAIVVVFDEGETTEQVPFVIISPGLAGRVTRNALDHYALTRLIDEVAGVPPLRHAALAPSVAGLIALTTRAKSQA